MSRTARFSAITWVTWTTYGAIYRVVEIRPYWLLYESFYNVTIT